MELSVPYNIAFYKAGEKLGSSPWNGTLDKAKQHAADYLCIWEPITSWSQTMIPERKSIQRSRPMPKDPNGQKRSVCPAGCQAADSMQSVVPVNQLADAGATGA